MIPIAQVTMHNLGIVTEHIDTELVQTKKPELQALD